jgi:hypothetical protein
MASTDPYWYCPQCETISQHKKKYCSHCEGHVMLKFHCPATDIDDSYAHFNDRHLPQCLSCRQYHRQLDDTTRENRRLHTKALADTTQGINSFAFCLRLSMTSAYARDTC